MLSTSTSCGGAERIYRRHPTYQLAQLGPTRSIYRMYQERCVRRRNGRNSIPGGILSRFFQILAHILFCNIALRVSFLNIDRFDQKVQVNFLVLILK